jgi:hypothetical protein
MKINRIWAMPSKNTFTIKPINKLISGIIQEIRVKRVLIGSRIIDPFAGNSPFNNEIDYSNDLDSSKNVTHNMDALEFIKRFDDSSVDCILFDPPYSPRQISEHYKKHKKTVNMQTTQASFWTNLKKEISRIMRKDGTVITCGWNSGGIGKTNGFKIEEILLVPHGGWHNDTIVTVERKS